MLDEFPTIPVVYLDADAVVWKKPELFDALDGDVAVHYRKGFELLNGTAYFAPTSEARRVAWKYKELIDEHPNQTNEQKMLDAAIASTPTARIVRLPAEYCWIHDIMATDIGDREPVIEHLQASRVVNVSPLLENRLRRLAQIEGIFGSDHVPQF